MKCFVFDLDGTLANVDHRLHHITGEVKDWRGFFKACVHDEPIAPMLDLWTNLKGQKIIFSGRSDEVRKETENWLVYVAGIHWAALYMRKEGDHRPDHVIKSEMLDQAIADGWTPTLFIDDRKQVVDMWRDRGYTCLQCAPGDF